MVVHLDDVAADRALQHQDMMDSRHVLVRPLLIDGDEMANVDPTTFLLPTGTVSFLLTDVEGSTRSWQEHPDVMQGVIARHYEILDTAIARWAGVRPVEQGEGDSVVGAFAKASDAIAAALDAQLMLYDEAWPDGMEVRVRMAVSTGEALQRDEGNYVGTAIIRAARIRNAAHGGQVLVGDSSASLAADALPAGATLIDLGNHRLKDLAQPTHIWQLAHPDLPVVTLALRSLDAFRHNLPQQPTPLIGRRSEIRALTAELASERLVTLTGSGGVGKTRLAAQIGAELVERFPLGVWWVDLAPIADGATIAARLLAAIGANEDGMRPALTIAADRLGAGAAMVVFDNCEHLVGEVAGVIESLRSSCPELVVLATSREPLGLPGEVTWRVPSLSVPPRSGPIDLASLGQYESVRLFLDRARRARPQLTLTDTQAAAIAEICSRLDGVALAIELAAARCRQLSPERIAADLVDRFRLLTGGARTLLPRQQTLLASIEWSHGLLDPDEQTVLRRLSVFAGPFLLEAAEAVLSFDDALNRWAVLDVISHLVDKSLVHLDESDSAPPSIASRTQYRLLETVRQFALDRARAAGELSALRDAQAQWWTTELERIDARQPVPDTLDLIRHFAVDLCSALDWLEPDLERRYRLLSLVALGWSWSRSTDLVLSYVDRWIISGPDAGHELAWSIARAACATAMVTGRRADPRSTPVDLAFVHIDAAQDGRAAMGLWASLSQGTDRPKARIGRAFELALADRCSVLLGPAADVLVDYVADEDTEYAQDLRGRTAMASQNVSTNLPLVYKGLVGDRLNPYGRSTGAPIPMPELSTDESMLWPRMLLAMRVLLSSWLHGRTDDFEPVQAFFQRQRHLPLADLWWHGNSGALHVLTNEPVPPEEIAALARYCAAAPFGFRALPARALISIGHPGAATELITSITGPGAATVLRPWFDAVLALHDERPLDAERLLSGAIAAERSYTWDDLRPDLLELSAVIASRCGDHARAVRLIGAATARRDANGVAYRWRDQQLWLDAAVAAAANALGNRARTELDLGRAMPVEDALELAVRGRGERKRPATGWDSLTPTERQVCALIAQGCSNPDIAERLFMARTTVKTHVSHALAKLGLRSRAELAAEVTRRAT